MSMQSSTEQTQLNQVQHCITIVTGNLIGRCLPDSAGENVDYGATCNELEWQTLPTAPVDRDNRRLRDALQIIR
jgi:hypothetical protein